MAHKVEITVPMTAVESSTPRPRTPRIGTPPLRSPPAGSRCRPRAPVAAVLPPLLVARIPPVVQW